MSFDFKPYKFTLLTGAGFSYPFRGLLAHEFGNVLFRRTQVQARPRVRELLLAKRDFEGALADVRSQKQFDQEDVDALETAVQEVFLSMDRDQSDVNGFREQPISMGGFQDFLKRFQCPCNKPENAGFIFTLNQDLMVERKWYNFNHWAYPPGLPGVPPNIRFGQSGRSWFSTVMREYDDTFEVTIPDDQAIDFKNGTHYVKLHGAFNWRTEDGRRALVVGTGKSLQIDALPLLSFYHQIFAHVLANTRKLMVVGYSFRDDHINQAIANAVINCGLEVHVWDPFTDCMIQQIRSNAAHEPILRGLAGLYSRKMHEVFPADYMLTNETSEWRDMRMKFFEDPH